jgi:hypothetical protein
MVRTSPPAGRPERQSRALADPDGTQSGTESQISTPTPALTARSLCGARLAFMAAQLAFATGNHLGERYKRESRALGNGAWKPREKTMRSRPESGVTVGRVPEGLRPDLAPLRSSRGFRLIFASRTVTALGAQASEVALLVQAKQLTGSVPRGTGPHGSLDMEVPGGAGFRRAPGRWGSWSACSYPEERNECGNGSKNAASRKHFVTTWHHRAPARPRQRSFGPNGRGACGCLPFLRSYDPRRRPAIR